MPCRRHDKGQAVPINLDSDAEEGPQTLEKGIDISPMASGWAGMGSHAPSRRDKGQATPIDLDSNAEDGPNPREGDRERAAMPRRGRDKGQAPIDLDSDAQDEGQSKRSRTIRTTKLKTSGSYDNLPQRRGNSRRNEANQDKLSTDTFELYMEDLWKHIDEDKKSAYAYLDSLWFNMYYHGRNIPNVLKWIKSKRIFSRQYVFVPIVCFGHWSLLVLCHFDGANCSDIKKGPRMIVLDSLSTTDPTRLQSAIRKLFHNDIPLKLKTSEPSIVMAECIYKIFIADIYKTEEREESKQFISKIRLEFPKVPQQNGDECGIYVLYFIHCFLQNKKLAEVLENKKLEEDFTQLLDDGWFNPEELENFRKDIHSFQANRNNKTAE